MFLFSPAMLRGMWDLSYPTREWTQAPCTGSAVLTTRLPGKASKYISERINEERYLWESRNYIFSFIMNTQPHIYNKNKICSPRTSQWFLHWYVLRNKHDASGKRTHLLMQETEEMRVWSLGWEEPLEEGKATIPVHCPENCGTEEPNELLCMGSQRVGHAWSNLAHRNKTFLWKKLNRLITEIKTI